MHWIIALISSFYISFISFHTTVLKTAYCLRGTTATGLTTHKGIIATDPSVFPMGTRMYVPGYGYGKAEDTGGKIIGHHIDVWMPSCYAAFHATRYNLRITVFK